MGNKETKKEVSIRLVDIKKDYYVDKKPFTAIKHLSLCFPRVGFVSILGESGSGKTTLLNIIGGLDKYTEGDLLINGKSTKDFKDSDWDDYRNKKIGFVFQSYNLIPHLSVVQNVMTPLQLAGVGYKEREEKAKEVLIKVGLGEMMKKKPNELSGGQMQRVAIARALVNNPEIILADEPTGALDSETSVQIMELIKGMASDRCVIMVTHNEKLAKLYSDRIIRMRDGEIVDDTDPLAPEEEKAEIIEPFKKKKKSSMSFWTALKSSTQNVLTKKGRTALTAVACSFGIIGVALVLATSNGFTQYIDDVEMSMASSVPITISPTTVSFKPVSEETYTSKDEYPDDNQIHVYDGSSSMFVTHQNNFTQAYIDDLYKMTNDPSNIAYGNVLSIMENHDGLDFHFLTEDGDSGSIMEVDQYAQASMFSGAVSSVTSLPSTVMHELYGKEDAMEGLYDVIYGRFPKAKDELVLVVDSYNRIEINTLQKLGIINSQKDYQYLSDKEKTIDFSQIVYDGLNDTSYKVYKAFRNSDYYLTKDGGINVSVNSWNNVKLNSSTMKFEGEAGTKNLTIYNTPSVSDVYNDDEAHNPVNLKIVGVLRPSPDSYLSLMPASIAYTSELTDYMVEDYGENGDGKALADAQKDNWFINRDENDSSKDGLAILNNAFESLIDNIGGDASDAETQIDSSMFNQLVNNVFTFYSATGKRNANGTVTISLSNSPSTFLRWCNRFGSSFHPVDLSSLSDEGGILGFVSLLLGDTFFESSGNPNIIDLVAAANSYSTISSILIFPKTLAGKDYIKAYLDSLNEGKLDKDQILYSDVMSDFTEGIGTMISVISAVLIVFASVSLVVSSVMTAIITYVSVVERTKEIGVLRACGARKRDVGRLFEAECVIVGGAAGIIGIAFTLLACVPINLVIDNMFPGNGLGSIASLAWWHALILIALSVILAFVSGFVPSRIASKRDPVNCLRSE